MNIITLKQYNDAIDSGMEDVSSHVMQLISFDEEKGADVAHPAMHRLLAGQQPADVDLLMDWRDDHVDCFLVSITYPDETFVMVMMWSGAEYLMKLAKTVYNPENCISFAKELVPAEMR